MRADILKDYINGQCEGVPAWKIIAVTAGTTCSVIWLHSVVFDPEISFVDKTKKSVFQWVRAIPYVKKKFEKERMKIKETLETDMNEPMTHGVTVYSKLPMDGRTSEQVLEEAKSYLTLGNCDWKAGGLSGCVYNYDDEVTKLCTEVFGLSAWSNPLHPDVFPGVRKMEAEIVDICSNLFHGGPETCGTMTSGGTESILLACKAYRDYARNVKGIKHPEMICPVSAHAAFHKASQLYRMRLVSVPVDPVTYKVDMKAMKRAINRNTCMLVGSAPGFPHGVIDPIEEIAALGRKYDIPVHVDACLGGFLLAFMEDAGYSLSPFDFRVDGVTSISVDTHKYGYTPKGTSIIVYSDAKYRYQQFSVTTEWSGGIYASPTLAGSRPGSLIATCWVSLMYYGKKGYIEATKKVMETQRYIESEINKIEGLNVMGKPDACAVAFDSREFNIYRVSDAMGKRGWNLNALQFPFGIHICITYLHTHDGVAQRFIADLKEIVADIRKNPCDDAQGAAAIYGMSQSIPDRSMVGEIATLFLEALYNLKTLPKANGIA